MEETRKIIQVELTPAERMAKIIEIMAEGALALSFMAVKTVQMAFLRLADLNGVIKLDWKDILVTTNATMPKEQEFLPTNVRLGQDLRGRVVADGDCLEGKQRGGCQRTDCQQNLT